MLHHCFVISIGTFKVHDTSSLSWLRPAENTKGRGKPYRVPIFFKKTGTVRYFCKAKIRYWIFPYLLLLISYRTTGKPAPPFYFNIFSIEGLPPLVKGETPGLSRYFSTPVERREKGIWTFLKFSYLFFSDFLKIYFRRFCFFRGFSQPGENGIFFRIGTMVYLHFHGNTSISSYSLFPRICGWQTLC